MVIASLLTWAVIVVLTGMISLKRLRKECVTKGVKLFFRISDGKRTLRISCFKIQVQNLKISDLTLSLSIDTLLENNSVTRFEASVRITLAF